MTPVEFPQQNVVFAKDQPEYLPLPAYKDETGQVVSFWKLEEGDLEKIKAQGGIYVLQLTFNQPLQPLSLHTVSPFVDHCEEGKDEPEKGN